MGKNKGKKSKREPQEEQSVNSADSRELTELENRVDELNKTKKKQVKEAKKKPDAKQDTGSKRVRLMLMGAIVVVLGLTVFNVMDMMVGMMWGLFLLGTLNVLNAYYNYKDGKKGDAIFMISSGIFIILAGLYLLTNIVIK